MKYIALIFHGFVIALSIWFGITFTKAIIQTAGWSWRPDYLAATFLFLLIVAVVALIRQLHIPFSAVLILQVLTAGFLLFLTLANHGYPDRAMIFGAAHLTLAFAIVAWNVYAMLSTTKV